MTRHLYKIYISSTYADLKDERQAAIKAVLKLGHMPVAMENYTAGDRKPVDKCLEDVRNFICISVFLPTDTGSFRITPVKHAKETKAIYKRT